jgi:hypothetical protein
MWHSHSWLSSRLRLDRYAARCSGPPSPRDAETAAILCEAVRGTGRAGSKRINTTKLNHSIPSATANDTKIATATATNPIPLSMATSSVWAELQSN